MRIVEVDPNCLGDYLERYEVEDGTGLLGIATADAFARKVGWMSGAFR